jgi:hypothetical protein
LYFEYLNFLKDEHFLNTFQIHGQMASSGHGLLEVSLGPAMPIFHALQTGHLSNGLSAVSKVALPQGEQHVAIFHPLEHPMMYVFVSDHNATNVQSLSVLKQNLSSKLDL